MRKFGACLCLVFFLSCLFAPTDLYARGGPQMPPPPKGGVQNVQDLLALLMTAIQDFLGGGGEPQPEPLP